MFSFAERSSSGHNSDSDFAPGLSDDDVRVPSSARGSSISGGRSELESSTAELDSDSDMSDATKGKKAKGGKTSRPSLKHAQSSEGGRSGGSSNFLTAAERRAQDKKTEKKTADDPFEFLKDVRDVGVSNCIYSDLLLKSHSQKDKNRPGDPGYDPRTLYIPNSAWKLFTPFEKQVSCTCV